MGVGWGLLGLVDEAIERIGMLLGAVAWEIGVVTVVEWPFDLLACRPCAILMWCCTLAFFFACVEILRYFTMVLARNGNVWVW